MKLFKNKKGSQLVEKVLMAAFSVAAGAGVIVYGVNVINNSKNANVDLNAGVITRTISEDEGTEGLQYTYNGEGYTITGYTGSSVDVVIPSTYEGLPVTEVGDDAVCFNDNIDTVVVGRNVRTLGFEAFYGLHNATSIMLPDTVSVIGPYAFGECDKLTSFIIPESVTTLEAWTFECGFTTINIPKNVSHIGEGVFSWCPKITSFTVSGENQYFCAENGVLFDKTKTKLVAYPHENSNSSYHIPRTVRSIQNGCFSWGETALSSIYIPIEVNSITSDIFQPFRNLTIYCEASSKPSGWVSYWNSSAYNGTFQTYWGVSM